MAGFQTACERPERFAADDLWSHVHWLGVLDVEGSYTSAAARLSVSKAAVSYRIAELKRAAGTALVQRTTRSVRLTQAGKRLVDSTREAFGQIERSFAGLRDLAAEPGGSLRMTTPVAFGRQHVAPRMAEFLKRFPSVRVELDLSDRLVSLAQEGFDLAVRHIETVPDTHVAWVLCESEALLVASEAYLRTNGTPASPQDLSAHRCLHYLRGALPTWSFEGSEPGSERLNVPIRGPFTANNSEVLRELAQAGAGIALLPDFSATDAIRAGRLVRVLPAWRPVGAFGGKVYAIRPYSPHVPKAVQVMVAFLRESFGAGFVP